MLYLLLFFLAVGFIAAAFQSYAWWSEWAFVVGAILGLITALVGFLAVVRLLSVSAEIAKIEQVRATVLRLGCFASEDVLGRALHYNEDLAASRYWNAVWYADPLVPDRWVTVEPIAIPTCTGS